MPGLSRFRVGFFIFNISLLLLPDMCRADNPISADQETEEVLFSEVMKTGLVFLNGEYIAAPYTVEATSQSISINGNPFQARQHPMFGEGPSRPGGGFNERRMGGGFGGNRYHFGNQNQAQAWQEAPSPGLRPAFPSGVGTLATRRVAREIVDALGLNQVILVFEQTRELIVIPRRTEPELISTLMTDLSEREISPELDSPRISLDTRELWHHWLLSFVPQGEAKIQVASRMDFWKDLEAENHRQVAATRRLDQYSYPLTLLGMLVGVVALGHLLRWPRKDEADETISQTARAVEIALWLMLGMALIDLTWTILATQAGVMKEVNPIAEKLVETPLQLAVFKTFATAVGFGIFYIWRRRRQIQVATWWMCLVCVLVTFRWIIFDSALSP